MNDYKKAKWKLTGMYILVFFILLNLFTISLFVILQKVENDYVQKTEIEWQKKQVIFSKQNITVLEWGNSIQVDKQEVIDLHKSFLRDIRHWIVIIETILLVLAGFVSYFLAGRTLRPIQQKNELQRQFLADVSHELKNPLSALKISLEIAQKQKHWSDSEVRDMFDDLEGEVTRLTRTTEDLLVLEQSKNTREMVMRDITEIIHSQMILLKDFAQKRNITIDEELEKFSCKVSAQDIEKIVFNLVHNAIKFSHPNGVVEIVLSQNGVLRIKDSGVGIDKEELPHIFDRFYKADTSRTFSDDNGSGLGLSIVKKIADSNNWKITIKSEVEKGSVFNVFLK